METGTDRIFYDGNCGLCDRGVQFVVRRDRSGTAFRFAPLQGETFRNSISHRGSAPLSTMIVQTHDGRLLDRSTAWIHILGRLDGFWRIAAWVLRFIPRPIRDAVYSWVAAMRHRMVARPARACALLSPAERARFDS
jgi:predicted DCC family thiol-disulfide oxidoreductase YuxK